MLKKQTHEAFSVQLTKLLCITLAPILITNLAFNGPNIVKQVMILPTPFLTGTLRYWTLLLSGYLTVILGYICIIFLYMLITNIQKDLIFTTQNVRLLQIIGRIIGAIAINAFVVGLTCCLPIIYIAVFTLFITLIVRTIRNVFAKAVMMQDELDYTV